MRGPYPVPRRGGEEAGIGVVVPRRGGGLQDGGEGGQQVETGGLLDAVDDGVDLPAEGLLVAEGLGAAVGEPGLGGGVDLDGEQPLQDLAAFLAVGPQEAGELSLGQHGDLAELGGVHAEQAADQLSGLVGAGGQPDPLAGGLQLLDDDLGLLLGGAGAALFGPLPGGRAGDPEEAAPDGDLQDHARAPGRGAWSQRRLLALLRWPGTWP
nr:hypothetical protein GCM10020093_037090 [Planobispora longispora]